MSYLSWSHQTAVFPNATTGIVITSTGDKAVFTPSRPCQVMRWGYVADVSSTVTPPVFGLDFRPTAGSNSGRVTGASSGGYDTGGGGTITTTALSQTAQGKGVYNNVTLNPANVAVGAGDLQLFIIPGNQLVFTVTTAATAGSGFFFVEYLEKPFVGDAKLPASQAGAPSFATSNMTLFSA